MKGVVAVMAHVEVRVLPPPFLSLSFLVSQGVVDTWLKPRPESGLDCLSVFQIAREQ